MSGRMEFISYVMENLPVAAVSVHDAIKRMEHSSQVGYKDEVTGILMTKEDNMILAIVNDKNYQWEICSP